jgi:predicted HTH transcriptional regulator
MANRTVEYLVSLVKELAKQPSETEWTEFKCNYNDPQAIGEYISALSNSATLSGKPKGYIVWGVNDESHKIEGTSFQYRKAKKGNEGLENWLSHLVSPRVDFRFYEIPIDGVMVLVLEIPCADKQPIRFSGAEYIRVGSNKKLLKDFPDKERELWRLFDTSPYELRVSMSNLEEEEVVTLLDYPKYYDRLELPIPRNREQVFDDLQKEKFLINNDAGKWDITNIGAVLIGKDIQRSENLLKKTVRVIWYKNKDRIEAFREKEFTGGYACTHEDIVQYIMTIVPQEEVIVDSIRKSVVVFPEIAVRELLANSMIHQALEQKGTSIMVEVFSDRIEFSNAGAPLIAIERIVDTVPVSRNENIAGFMRKCGICEERGSGYDKIIAATSDNKMPAPKVENQNNQFTKAVLLAGMPFDMMAKEDKIWTCYMRACLAYVGNQAISNVDIRTLFGLSSKELAKASRIIKETVERGLIKPLEPDTAPRYMKYIPFWA